MAPRQVWYEEMLEYTNRLGITIIIDSDILNAPSTSGKKYIYNEEKNEIIIDGCHLTAKEENAILKFLVENQEEGIDIVNSEQEETIDNYQGYSDTYNPYKDTIQLLTPLIPLKDILALKMAFFMRIKNEADEDIKEYRKSIRDRFGLRGLYIANLCNQGYFENQFRTKALQLDNAKFREFYELRVGMELAAIFVHNGMTKRILQEQVRQRLVQCSQNDIFKFRIHAMGGENVDLVKEVITDKLLTEADINGNINTTAEELHRHPVYTDVEIEIL